MEFTKSWVIYHLAIKNQKGRRYEDKNHFEIQGQVKNGETTVQK